MLELLNRLGLQINKEKLSEPSQNVVFLGILLNTISCTASLPPEKLDQIRNEVNLFLEKCRASKHQLQSIAGRLNFASQVVHGGRTFLRRILDSIVRLKRPFHKVKIQGALRQDLLWWQQYLVQFNSFHRCMRVYPIVTDS